MKILFDNGVPNALSKSLLDHEVTFSRTIGWHELRNGDLIRQCEEAGFELLLTTDKNIRYQQNLSQRRISLVVLGNPRWPIVQLYLAAIVTVVERSSPGSYEEVAMPVLRQS